MISGGKYQWTKHSLYKMRYYGLSAQRIKRVVRHPARTEEAIVPNLIAVMCPNKKQEIWAMYRIEKGKSQSEKYFRIITAWRYPGKSSARNPIPQEILDEIRNIIT
ncbi:MAG: hypothetical protein AAB789_00790 [Patescibacteria group bacterium]